ncbi:MAG TPA: PIN domain-containing protein, partial [Solirubrobacteraceae bacterium]|nr:PIN domain-containing protein [Solirubrobacteraceae bacterium]
MSVLLDAFALIALLTDEPAAETVEVLLRRGDAAMTVVNLAEALDVLRRIEKVPADRLEALTAPLLSKYVELR